MLKIKLFIILLLIGQRFAVAQDQELMPGMYNDYAGKIDGRNVSLSLYLFGNGDLKGNYCTATDDKRIELTGTYTVDNKLSLTEFSNEKPTGYLVGKVLMDSLARFEGTWMNISKTRKIPFMLRLTSGVTAEFGYRYKKIGSEEGVESFMRLVKAAITTQDKQWIANHLTYPLKTHLNGVTPIDIKGKDQLISNFEAIFYPQYVETIKSLCACNLFHEWENIMLGDGQVYITSDVLALDGFRIISVNNVRK